MSDYAYIPGVGPITCRQAAEYRDGKLFKEYESAMRQYDEGKEERIRLVRQKFEVQKGRLLQAWSAADSTNKRKVAANAVGVVLSIGGLAAGKAMGTRSALSEIERKGADILITRGTTFVDTAFSGGLTGEIRVSDIALLPALTLVTVIATPVISTAVTAVGIGVGVIGLGDSLWQYFIDEQDYSQGADRFSDALQQLAEKSVSTSISQIMALKNEIDLKCGNR